MRRGNQQFVLMLGCLLVLLAACSESDTGSVNSDGGSEGTPCSYTYQCDQGFICDDGSCVSAAELADGSDDETTDGDGIGDGRSEDVDGADDSQDVSDSDDVDGEDTEERVTFAPSSFRTCTDDLECAVFGGDCIVEIPLSRPDTDGTERVALSDLDDRLADGEGVCSLSCTNDPRICSSMTIEGPNGEEASFRCQLIYTGENPYPESPPAFPFDGQLDGDALRRGVAFASICRPPFEYAEAHSASFCQSCQLDDDCSSDSVCYIEQPSAASPSGSCIQSCDSQEECPFGFRCEAYADGDYCKPVGETCGRCRDKDGDLRGVGRCGPIEEPITAIDCDDSRPSTYFTQADPDICEQADRNCDGLSDRKELLGSAEHCSECGATCSSRPGEISNARKRCEPATSGDGFECIAACNDGFANCDGDIETGCETAFDSDAEWFRDADRDGRGYPGESRYFCNSNVPDGWVQNDLDCDDDDETIYGGNDSLSAAAETCDGVDNNCNDIVDGEDELTDVGEDCDTEEPGVCAAGTTACVDAGTEEATLSCQGETLPEDVEDADEICDGVDNNCNGEIDEDIDYYEATGQTNPNGPGAPATCTVEGAEGVCRAGIYECQITGEVNGVPTAEFVCVGQEPEAVDRIDREFEDSNCDGSDGNLSEAVFVRPAGEGDLNGNDSHTGGPNSPLATIQEALNRACDANGCDDIYVETGVYPTTSAIEIPGFASTPASGSHVRIYGGFSVETDCDSVSCTLDWTRVDEQSEFIRNAPPENGGSSWPFGRAYAAIVSDSQPLNLTLQSVAVEVRAPDVTRLTGGDNAPTQIGVQIGQNGFSRLELIDVSISVDRALAGGDGTPAEAAPYSGSFNGTQGIVYDSDGMPTYPDEDSAIAASAGGTADGCNGGSGGYGAGPRYKPGDGGDRLYKLTAGSGGGSDGGSGGRANTGSNQSGEYGPSRGGGGSGGAGGDLVTHSVSAQYIGDDLYTLDRQSYSSEPGGGGDGDGGGGGAGCAKPGGDPPPWTCIPSDKDIRGGGGGAGGCGGNAGQNAGHGGSTVGLWLTKSYLSPVGKLIARADEFSIELGNAGDGGTGSDGGAGGPGGIGGDVPNAPDDRTIYDGADGGDGGGAGGGAGGIGGSSYGLITYCSSGCAGTNFELPPRLTADPGAYITTGEAGAAGDAGEGGEGGKSPGPDSSSNADPGGTGDSGAAGERSSILEL